MELVKKLAKQEEVTKLTHITENIFQETDDLYGSFLCDIKI